MATVQSFIFNPFSENTYVVYDETLEAVIVDPGCFTKSEKQELSDFISHQQLRPVRLLNTHCHLDHVFGNRYVFEKYGLLPEIHEGELAVLEAFVGVARQYGFPIKETSPTPEKFIAQGELIGFGSTVLESLFTPGHSPASLSFYCEASQFILSGDVLFRESIGRTDLPGGNHKLLLQSIRNQLFTLPDEIKVYSGHGEPTNIGYERLHNPFLKH